MPKIIVYHITTQDNAEKILKEGFKAYSWFSKDINYVMGCQRKAYHHLFEVVLSSQDVDDSLEFTVPRAVTVDEIASLQDMDTEKYLVEYPERTKDAEYVNP
jgi:hypothetical protein